MHDVSGTFLSVAMPGCLIACNTWDFAVGQVYPAGRRTFSTTLIFGTISAARKARSCGQKHLHVIDMRHNDTANVLVRTCMVSTDALGYERITRRAPRD